MGGPSVLRSSSSEAATSSKKVSTQRTGTASAAVHVPPSSNENVVRWSSPHPHGRPSVESLLTTSTGRDAPQEQEENPATMDVRAFMMSLGTQENRNRVEEEVISPGVVFVGGTHGLQQDEATVFEVDNTTTIVAHLAPDEADVEAMVNERLATMIMPVVKEVEERLRQQHELNRKSFVRDTNTILVEEVTIVEPFPPPPPPEVGWKKRRKLIMGFIFLVVIGGGVAFMLLKDNDSKDEPPIYQPASSEDLVPSEAPSLSPVPLETLMDELRSWIAPTEVDERPFMDSTSPQSQALAWLQDDPITQTAGRSTRTVLERYVLAVFYYSTDGPSSMSGKWMSHADVCQWNRGEKDDLAGKSAQQLAAEDMYGVHCSEDGESIDVLGLNDYDLLGSLPWEFVLLTNLRYMNVHRNFLSGTIPTQIRALTNLEVFLVGKNRISGTLPTALGQLPNLTYLDVSDNGFSGPIPTELGPMSSLKSALFQFNALSGSVEESLCTRSSWSSLGADCAEVACSCCTLCCYNVQTNCDVL